MENQNQNQNQNQIKDYNNTEIYKICCKDIDISDIYVLLCRTYNEFL